MTAYYNEINPYAAQFLRNLIAAGHIAPGDVDTRDIRDVRPDDLRGYRQCHFFAGVGVWSYALRRAGWGDDRPVWTGSCPCQPFSAAGAGLGFSDERHLWPHFYWLISERRPAVVLGEQVASKDADPWIDLVCDDLEAVGYAVGAIPFPSAGVGAPHIRDRLYWVAHAHDAGLEGRFGVRERAAQRAARSRGVAGRVADADSSARGQRGAHIRGRSDGGVAESRAGLGGSGVLVGLADASNIGLDGWRSSETSNGRDAARVESERLCDVGERPGPINGFWRDADWLLCRDGKWRPVEPGTFPLAHGAPARVGRLRAYGNAINAEAAIAWIESVMESL